MPAAGGNVFPVMACKLRFFKVEPVFTVKANRTGGILNGPRTEELIQLARRIRMRSPQTTGELLSALENAFVPIMDIDACALEISDERTIYVTRPVAGLTEKDLLDLLDGKHQHDYSIIALDSSVEGEPVPPGKPDFSIARVPLFRGRDSFGVLSFVKSGSGAIELFGGDPTSMLSEVLSLIVLSYSPHGMGSAEERRGESVKAELLKAIGDELTMRGVLLKLLEMSKAEIIAYYTEMERGELFIMLDGRELSPRIPEVREKIRTAYRMFTNSCNGEKLCRELVFFKRQDSGLANILRNHSIESYFLVPVTSESAVRGTLFVGSVRRDAFVRENIGVFRSFAEDETPLVFSAGEETGILEKVLATIPFGSALVAPDGRIVSSNRMFRAILQLSEPVPAHVNGIGAVSPFNLAGVWEEFRSAQCDLIDRELRGTSKTERAVSVTWIVLKNLAAGVGSLVFLEDVTVEKEQVAAHEEVLATVAHELRTPMTALKNSLKIIMEGGSAGARNTAGGEGADRLADTKFLETALRTTNRLSLIVDSLVNASSVRISGRPLELERVDARSYINEASRLFKPSLKKKGIRFDIDLEEGIETILIDRDRMEQVIQNLLSNSIKNVPSGGSISLSVSRCVQELSDIFPAVHIPFVPRPRFMDICVRDTGGGVPREVAERVNLSGDSTLVLNRPNRGLGLYIAQRLMFLHGGALVIRVNDAGDSAVHLYLPEDLDTGRVVLAGRGIGEVISRLVEMGEKVVLYAMVKESQRCWLEIAGSWTVPPIVDPTRDEIDRTGVYLWPFGEGFAVSLTAVKRFIRSPFSLVRGGRGGVRILQEDGGDNLRIGWAVSDSDGTRYSGLLMAALEKVSREMPSIVRKGEW